MKSNSFPNNLGRGEKYAFYALMGTAAIIVFGSLFGLLVQFLWNATLVPLAGAGEISFWQAIGILILAKLFFGFGSGSSPKKPKGARKMRKDIDLLKQKEFREYWDREGRDAYESFKAAKTDSDTPSTKSEE